MKRKLQIRDGSSYSGDVMIDDVGKWMSDRPTVGSEVVRRFDQRYPQVCRDCWERWERYQNGEVLGEYGVMLEVREPGGTGWFGFRPECGTLRGCDGCPQGGGGR